MSDVKMDGLEGGSPGTAMFEGFLRSGSGGIEIKAMSGASDAAGGYAVPESIDAQIDATLKSISPIRAIANVVRVALAGMNEVRESRAGDVLLLRTGPGQLHLAICSGDGLVHADAMLRRLVERPGCDWPVVGRWRIAGEQDGDAGAERGGAGAGRADRAGDRRDDRQLHRPRNHLQTQGP